MEKLLGGMHYVATQQSSLSHVSLEFINSCYHTEEIFLDFIQSLPLLLTFPACNASVS